MLVPADEFHEFLEWSESEIDLTELFSYFWGNRRFIAKVTAAAALFGILLSLMMAPEYTTTASLMPEYRTETSVSGTAQSLLQQYGGMLGISGDTYASGSNAIRVELYPQIVQSLPFQLDLIEQEYYYPEYDTTASLFSYFNSIYRPSVLDYIMAYTVALPFTVRGWISYWVSDPSESAGTYSAGRDRAEILNITEEQMEVIEQMQQRVSTSLDQESGVISVQVTMPEPRLTAAVGKRTIDNLTEYLINYRTEKVKVDLAYVRDQYQKAEQRFNNIRDSLAAFRDANQHIVTARAQTEEQQLQSRYDLAFNLYNSMAGQLEQTKLRLQEETPVFEVLEPVQVPIEKSSPRRMLITVVCLLLGGFGAVVYLLARKWIRGSDWNSTK